MASRVIDKLNSIELKPILEINKSFEMAGSDVKSASEYWDEILRICEDLNISSKSETKSESPSLAPALNDEELQHLRNTVLELRKLCCCILGQLHDTNQNMAQLRNNLTEKELLFVNLSKQLVELKASYCLDRLKTFVAPSVQPTVIPDAALEKKETNMSKSCRNCETNHGLVQSLLTENERLERRLCFLVKSLQQLSSELRESHQNYDSLELAFNWCRNEMKSLLKMRNDECELMRERVNYLTSKLITVDRAYRATARKSA